MKNYTDHLGLNHDPFSPSAKTHFFFGGAGRDELLRRIVEQAHYGAPISAVCGPLGSGKSVLAEEFRKCFSEEALCISVQSTLFMNQSQFLEAVLQQLPIGASSPEPMDIVEDLCHFAERLFLDAKTLVLVIDDAHELASEVLETIETLVTKVAESGIHILLLGESQLGNLLHNALSEEMTEKLLEEELLPLSSSDAIRYIDQKLDHAGYKGPALLDNSTVGILVNESNGMPGAMNARIAEALNISTLKPESSVSPARVSQDFWFPTLGKQYWLTAGALCFLLVAALLFPSGEENGQPVAAAVETTNNRSQRIDIPLDLGQEVEVQEAELLENRSVFQDEPEEIEAAVQDVVAPPAPVSNIAASEVEILPEVSNSEERLISKLEEAASADSEPGESEEEIVTAMASEFEQQLLSYPAENFTVQIMGSRSEDNVRRFVTQELGALNRGYFETRYQEQPWFVVVMGNFVSRDAATRALTDLPGDIRSLKPWVRSLTDVQSDIRQIRGLN